MPGGPEGRVEAPGQPAPQPDAGVNLGGANPNAVIVTTNGGVLSTHNNLFVPAGAFGIPAQVGEMTVSFLLNNDDGMGFRTYYVTGIVIDGENILLYNIPERLVGQFEAGNLNAIAVQSERIEGRDRDFVLFAVVSPERAAIAPPRVAPAERAAPERRARANPFIQAPFADRALPRALRNATVLLVLRNDGRAPEGLRVTLDARGRTQFSTRSGQLRVGDEVRLRVGTEIVIARVTAGGLQVAADKADLVGSAIARLLPAGFRNTNNFVLRVDGARNTAVLRLGELRARDGGVEIRVPGGGAQDLRDLNGGRGVSVFGPGGRVGLELAAPGADLRFADGRGVAGLRIGEALHLGPRDRRRRRTPTPPWSRPTCRTETEPFAAKR